MATEEQPKKRRGRPPKNKSVTANPEPKPVQNSEDTFEGLTEQTEEPTTQSLAEEESTVEQTFDNCGFNLFDDEFDVVNQTKETLVNLADSKKNRNVSLLNHNTFDSPYLPFSHFGLQVVTNMRGLPSGKLYELIAKDGVGKSTLAFTLGGMAMRNSIPMIYIETESKLMEYNRIKRCLHKDKNIAEKMGKRILMAEAFNLNQAWDTIRSQVDALRNKNQKTIPKNVPIFIVLDTFSKLLSKEEAQGKMQYGDLGDKSKYKETGEATNFGHSSFAHVWCRELPLFLHDQNCILMVISHKNDKVDMTGFGSMFSSTKTDRTKIGGNAFNQNAACQFIINRKGFYKRSQEQIGETMQLIVTKNSYGPGNNDMDYNLITRHKSDTEDTQEMALEFDTGLANYLIDHKYLDLSCTRQKYSSKELNLTNASASEFSEAFHNNQELINYLGKQLQIAGYK